MVGRASRTAGKKKEPPRIRIAGRFLDEVGIAIERTPGLNSTSTMRFPAHNHALHKDGSGLALRVPTILAVQLFFDGTLSKEAGSVTIQYGDVDLGQFAVKAVESPRGDVSSRNTIIRLARIETEPAHQEP